MLRKKLILAACVVSAQSFSGVCQAADFYDTVRPGTLKGKLIVQWVEPDIFLFIPDRSEPLSFTRHNGVRIEPGRMLTDGGSIPRPIWILRSYSPWGFAPAYIVHDWVFERKHCKLSGHEQTSFQDSAMVMAEVMKTMMESKKVAVDRLTVASMHAAVSSSIAESHWNNGRCTPPPPGLGGVKPILEYSIEF